MTCNACSGEIAASGSSGSNLDVVLLREVPDPLEHCRAERGQRLADGQRIFYVLGHRPRVLRRPRQRVSWRIESEDGRERAGGSVSRREGVSETPLLAQCGDQRRVAVLLVEDRPGFDPRATR